MSNWQNVMLTKWQVCKNGQAVVMLLGQGALQFANFITSWVFVADGRFQSSLMFVGKAMRLPRSGVHEKCFNQVDSSLTHEH
jgi:hypothetical protein